MPTIGYYMSQIKDPWINLAFEEWLFRKAPQTYILYMWRNTSCVVIGRNQNPWRECHITALENDKIPLIRRRSGGGCVYHDIGNTNYTIIMPRTEFNRRTSAEIVSRALHQLDIPSEVNERHDITIHQKKVSGSAFKIVSNRSYHHGTMLIDANLSQLSKYLSVKEKPLFHGGGVESVRSPVTLLRDYSYTVDHLTLSEAIAKEFSKHYGKENRSLEPIHMTMETFEKDEFIQKQYQELKTWDWTFGQTPNFEFTIENGGKRTKIRVNEGCFESFEGELSPILAPLIGKRFTTQTLEECQFLNDHALYHPLLSSL